MRAECFDKVLILGERHLGRVLTASADYYNHARPVRHEVAPHEWNRDRNVSKPRLVSKPVPNLHMHSWQQECVKLEVTPKKASSQKMQSGKGKSGRVNANEPLLRSRYRGDAANG